MQGQTPAEIFKPCTPNLEVLQQKGDPHGIAFDFISLVGTLVDVEAFLKAVRVIVGIVVDVQRALGL